MLSDDLRCSQMLSDDLRCSQMLLATSASVFAADMKALMAWVDCR
jgi:hypothetical protein